ncbi:MAG TPA: FecR family protein [Nitrospiraceae bacterium]|nr:FecR family protein [Nitrospiraceae bacterium]
MSARHGASLAQQKTPLNATAMPCLGIARTFVGWIGVLMILLAPPGWGHDAAINPVGQVTAMQGRVMVTHPGDTKPVRITIPHEVVPHDVIHTEARARSKILLQDDTLLTIGENSMVEIAEHIYDSSVDTRSVTLALKDGKVRALVGPIFGGKGSKFSVRTPTALIASQGTYFAVWTDGSRSGVANIGTTGQVSFTSGDRTVVLNPGQFTVAVAHIAPPAPGFVFGAPDDVKQAVVSTEFTEVAVAKSAQEVVRSFDQRRESFVSIQWSTPTAMVFLRP